MCTKQSLLVAVLVSVSTFGGYATAALLEGNVVQSTYFRGVAPDITNTIGPVTSVVGPGVELTGFADLLNVDFSDTGIVLTATRNAVVPNFFELIRFADVNGTIPNFTSVTIGSGTNFANFGASRIQFIADLIQVNLTGLPILQGQVLTLAVAGSGGPGPGTGPGPVPTPEPGDPGTAIPEPSTMALLGFSGVFLILSRLGVQKNGNGSAPDYDR
jgi:hypothetical protein